MPTSPTPTMPASVRGKTILIVDDDPMIRILLQETLWIYAKQEHHLHSVSSVEEAQKCVTEEGYPDVVIIGLSLLARGKDGSSTREMQPSLHFTDQLKNNHPQTKVVIYSKHSEEALKEQALAAGADAYIVKGECTPSEFADFIEKL